MLQHLTERRLLRLVPETKKYEIGSEFISLALKVSSATNSLALIAHPFMVQASQDTGNDINIGALLDQRSEEHTSELQSLMRLSYAVFCLKKKTKTIIYKNAIKLNDDNMIIFSHLPITYSQ